MVQRVEVVNQADGVVNDGELVLLVTRRRGGVSEEAQTRNSRSPLDRIDVWR